MSDLIVVITTIDDHELARTWAEQLIVKQLAACVQIVGPIESVYEWEKQILHETEWQLQIKTAESRQPDLMAWIKQNHPYEIPEIITLPVTKASEGYGRWVMQQLSK